MHVPHLLPCLLCQCSKHNIIKLLHTVQLITHRGGQSWTETIEFECDLPMAVQPNETARQSASMSDTELWNEWQSNQ